MGNNLLTKGYTLESERCMAWQRGEIKRCERSCSWNQRVCPPTLGLPTMVRRSYENSLGLQTMACQWLDPRTGVTTAGTSSSLLSWCLGTTSFLSATVQSKKYSPESCDQHGPFPEATANQGQPDINGPLTISAGPQGAEMGFPWFVIKRFSIEQK